MKKQSTYTIQQAFGFADEDIKTSLHDEIVLWVKRNAEDIGGRLIRWTKNWDPELIESNRSRAAATVAERVNLLQESLAKEESKLDLISCGRSQFYKAEDVEKRIKAMELELGFLCSWKGLGHPPAPKLDVRCEIERVILRRLHEPSGIAGFIDVVLFVRALGVSAGVAPCDDYGRPYLGVDARTYADWNTSWTEFRSFAFDAKSAIRSLGELIRQFKAYRLYSNLPLYAVSPDAGFANDISDEGFGFISYPEGTITFPKSPLYRAIRAT